MNQYGQLWSSTEFGASPELDVEVVELSDDRRLAVVISWRQTPSMTASPTRRRSVPARS